MNTQPHLPASNPTTGNLFDVFPVDLSKLDLPSLPTSRTALSFMDTLTPTPARPTRELVRNYQPGKRFVLPAGYVLDASLSKPCGDAFRCPECGGRLVSNWYRDEAGILSHYHHCAESLGEIVDGVTCAYFKVQG